MNNPVNYNGIILKGIGGFYYVEAADAVYECKARGVFRKNRMTPLAGDRVEITVSEGAENTVDKISERKNVLQRPPVANLDNLILVVSTKEPVPNTLVMDKLTVIAESKGIEPIIVITKADLAPPDALLEIYKKAGFSTFCISDGRTEETDALKALLKDKISAFTGNSGVGKSTLLNRLDVNLALPTGNISEKLGRGRHTTREVTLFKSCGGYIADTPGFSSLDFEKNELVRKDDLPHCFREFEAYLGLCRFSTCTHTCDKGCRIVEAVEKGEISVSRHNSYKAMYEVAKNIKEWEL